MYCLYCRSIHTFNKQHLLVLSKFSRYLPILYPNYNIPGQISAVLLDLVGRHYAININGISYKCRYRPSYIILGNIIYIIIQSSTKYIVPIWLYNGMARVCICWYPISGMYCYIFLHIRRNKSNVGVSMMQISYIGKYCYPGMPFYCRYKM